MNGSAILRAEHLVKTFGSGHAGVRAVDDVSLVVNRGEMVVIMGPSGSGKTTLVSMLGALLSPGSGTVAIDGVDLTTLDEAGRAELRAHKIGFIFQSFNLLESLSVFENVVFPAQLASGGIPEAKPRAEALLKRLKLSHRLDARPNTLSGGEKQRVAIARALINRPGLMFADEPTGNLDSESGQEVMMILYDITRDEDCSVVIVTHDQRVVDVADRLLWLEDGALRDRKSEKRSWVKDPVCGMRVDEWTATLFSEHGSTRYTFCSRRCQERFKADPEHYVSLTTE